MKRQFAILLSGFCSFCSFFLPFSSVRTSTPHSSLAIERIYAPFDSLRTDIHDYAWPTERYLTITSSFAEFRDAHFHAGIDISTNGKKGYRVYASRDGFVSRIVISPYGYGKMLYICHADGFTTSYAHLQHFNESIDHFVKSQQYAGGEYSIDVRLTPEQFPVKKGELIAYTGDTGVGNAHLHFELRDETMNPVSPLLLPEFASLLNDRTPPTFQEISFLPLEFNSVVQGDVKPWTAAVRRISRTDFAVPGIVHLTGAFGVGVKALDRIGYSQFPNRPNRYEVFIDDAPVFTANIQRFPEKEYKQIALHYDWNAYRSGKGRFQKMYIEPGNRLPFYDRQPEWTGRFETEKFPEGFHQIKIVAKDLRGNAAQLRATVVFNHPPEINLKYNHGRIIISSGDPSNIDAISLVSGSYGRNRQRSQRLLSSSLTAVEEGLELHLDSSRFSFFRVVAENRYGTKSRPEFLVLHPPKSSNTSLAIKKEFIRDFVSVTVSSHLPFTLRPSVWVTTKNRRWLLDISALDANKYVGTLPFSPADAGEVQIQASADVNGSNTVEAVDEFSVFPITPDHGGTIVAGNGEFTLTFPPDAVYQTVYCRVEKTRSGYTVLPDDVVLNQGARVEYRLSDGEAGSLGLFIENGQGWELLDWTNSTEKRILSGRVERFLGEFSLFSDNSPPELSHIRTSYWSGRLFLSFRLLDNLAGTAADKLQIRVDGQLIIGEYDPYNRTVKFDDQYPLASGNHLLTIEAQDRMGNAAYRRHFFNVSPRQASSTLSGR